MAIDPSKTVREIAIEVPYAPRVFESLGIDYCCGGKKPLAEACAASGVALESVVERFDKAELEAKSSRAATEKNWADSPAAELIQQIVTTHHVYVREQSPRLQQLFAKVASKHGQNHPELILAKDLFDDLVGELSVHLMKEEQILFPYVLRMEESRASGEPAPPSCFGTVRNPIAMMLSEHDNAGDALKEIRKETNDLKAPSDACVSYQTLYRDLLAFEADLHQHIHLENNILFPLALAMEEGK